MTKKAWFSRIGNLLGDLSRSFCIRRALGPLLVPCSSACTRRWPKTFDINENVTIFGVFAARKNAQKGMFFRYSVTSPHPTAKPSWGWLRIGVRKPRLFLAEFMATWNKVTAPPRSYCRGCWKWHFFFKDPLKFDVPDRANARAHAQAETANRLLSPCSIGSSKETPRNRKPLQ